MQEDPGLEEVTPVSTRTRRRRGGLRFSSRRELLRARMVRKQARTLGLDLQGTVRTLSYPRSTSASREDGCREDQVREVGQLKAVWEHIERDSNITLSSQVRTIDLGEEFAICDTLLSLISSLKFRINT